MQMLPEETWINLYINGQTRNAVSVVMSLHDEVIKSFSKHGMRGKKNVLNVGSDNPNYLRQS